MRAGTGESLVHTEERLQVEKQNDTMLFRKERMETGALGGSFYKFACVVLHIVLPYLIHWIWGSLAGNAGVRSHYSSLSFDII